MDMSSIKGFRRILISLVCLCILILIVAMTSYSSNKKERIIKTVIGQVFTSPSPKLEREINNFSGGNLVGENVPIEKNASSNIEKVLSEMYKDYFTDNAFNKFNLERISLRYLLFANQHNYKVSVKKIDSKKDADMPNYYLFSTELLVENENGIKDVIIENGTILFNDSNKIEDISISEKLLYIK